MQDVSNIKKAVFTSDKIPVNNVNDEKITRINAGFSRSIFTLITSVGVNFFRYLKSLGISGRTDLIVLSSKRQYYCDKNDLKNARILINLRKLNLIKHLDLFLNSLVRILPPDTNFIGFFSENRTLKEKEFTFSRLSGIFSRIKKILGFRTYKVMNKNEVSEILEKNGFKIDNMTKMNGLTYFNSHNTRRPA
jgi:hypothetical protein